MFDSAELGHRIDKKAYDRAVPDLRARLLEAQVELGRAARFPVIVLVGGVDGAGKGETVNLLTEWMDPRHIRVHAMGEPTAEERSRPPMWRFWGALPPKGTIGIFFGSWYTAPIVDRVTRRTGKAELSSRIEEIVRFERMLVDEGALLVKLWFHLSKDAQERRLVSLERDPKTRWRVTPQDWERFALYKRFRRVSEQALRETSTAATPWIVVEGADARYRNLTVGKLLLDAMRSRLDGSAPNAEISQQPPQVPAGNLAILRDLRLGRAVGRDRYRRQLETFQGRLNLLSRDRRFARIAVVTLFEGNDAAGKGGVIRRVTAALDARHYRIVPVAAPSDEERAQPYLWRFWRHVPPRGGFSLFDRSWYGRVLVERVEGFASDGEWTRAYGEIVDFEEQLMRSGIVLAKFWLAVSKDEQLRRFRERESVAFKRFKITPEDWRNRERWDAYEQAVCDMVARTSTKAAPWTLVEADDKYHARIKVLRTLCTRIEHALEGIA